MFGRKKKDSTELEESLEESETIGEYLTEIQRLNYLAMYHKLDALESKLRATQLIGQQLKQLPIHAPVWKNVEQQKKLAQDYQAAKRKLNNVVENICEERGIDLETWTEYLLDLETGKLTHSPLSDSEDVEQPVEPENQANTKLQE